MTADPRLPASRWDRTVTLSVYVGTRRFGAWSLAVASASALGLGVWCGLSLRAGLPVGVVGVVPVVWAVIALANGFRPRTQQWAPLVWHHFALPSIGVSLVVAEVGHADLGPVLDALALASTSALAVGRLGCQATGCCTGRSWTWGARYPWFGDNTRHLPLPVLESALCALLLTGGLVAAGRVSSGVTGLGVMASYLCWRLATRRLRMTPGPPAQDSGIQDWRPF